MTASEELALHKQGYLFIKPLNPKSHERENKTFNQESTLDRGNRMVLTPRQSSPRKADWNVSLRRYLKSILHRIRRQQ